MIDGFWPAKAAGQGCDSPECVARLGGGLPRKDGQADRQTGWLWMVEIGDNDARGRRTGAASEERLDWKREVAAADEGSFKSEVWF